MRGNKCFYVWIKYTAYLTGVEGRYPISDKLRNISRESDDEETIKNIERIRMEPDTLFILSLIHI